MLYFKVLVLGKTKNCPPFYLTLDKIYGIINIENKSKMLTAIY
nr:MAG TPA: protein of unknown function (DUF4387) [Caudoviricetes sp.]